MEGNKAMPAQDADKTLKIRRPWCLRGKKLLKRAALATALVVLAAGIVLGFCLVPPQRTAVTAAVPKDSGPAAGIAAAETAGPTSQPTAVPTATVDKAAAETKSPPSQPGPTVVIEVPKPTGFDASGCQRWQWKRTRRGFVFDIRCVRVIQPKPRHGR